MRLAVLIGAGVFCLLAVALRASLRLSVRHGETTRIRLHYLCFFKTLTSSKTKPKKNEPSPSSEDASSSSGIQALLALFRNLKDLEVHFPSLRLQVRSFLLAVGNQDPAKTVGLYELALAAVWGLHTFLRENLPRFEVKRGELLPDFVSGRSSFSIDFVLSASLLDVIRFLYQVTTDDNAKKTKSEVA